MKTPTTDQEWIETLWALEGISYVDAAALVGWSNATVAGRAQKHKFRRYYGQPHWKKGPCLSCGRVFGVGDLSEERTCAGCEAFDESLEESRLELRETRRTCIKEERRKRDQRAREREMGLRDPLPDPCVFRWHGGDRMGSRMPGAA